MKGGISCIILIIPLVQSNYHFIFLVQVQSPCRGNYLQACRKANDSMRGEQKEN